MRHGVATGTVSAGYFGPAMRRITVVLGVCALAAVWTSLTARGSAVGRLRQAAQRRTMVRAEPLPLKADLARLVASLHSHAAPRSQRTASAASAQGTTCFVSSASDECSLIPCEGFVAASRGPDWVPITPQRCRGRSHAGASYPPAPNGKVVQGQIIQINPSCCSAPPPPPNQAKLRQEGRLVPGKVIAITP